MNIVVKLTVIIFCMGASWPVNVLLAQGNVAARYEIDAKRTGVNPTDKDALPRSREFLRLDSTYYVGHMYEGIYKAEKSSDALGYKHAIDPLHKAFVLLQRDYGRNLTEMYTSPENYLRNINRYIDFLQVSNSLRECYDNLEMADSVMWLLNQVDAYRFPKEHFPVTTLKAWTYHRNRFYTPDKFAFLKNSVEANEKQAFSYCYQALSKITRNEARNNLWFGPGQAEGDRQSVYHYLALLHCYNKQYDSSEYYYQKMIAGGSVSWNNYGNMQHELGNFAQAIEYFNRDRYRPSYEKVLREPYYYLPMLEIYGGRTRDAISIAKEAIEFAGSTPGFGWYNIALGRSYLYDGQLDSAAYALDKAANFKEIHIGTTLTQSQYDFTVNLLRLQLADRRIGLVKFHNRGWWYSPAALFNIAKLKVEKILLEYVLINQLSENPERDRTVYDLFCSEATTSFDETLYLISDFSPAYFIKKYRNYQQTDPRTNIQRYFKLVTNHMLWTQGNEEQAMDGYKQLVQTTLLDTTNEKLYLGRLYQALSKGFDDAGDQRSRNFYANALYERFPQLMPFGNMEVDMKLHVSGVDNQTISNVVKELKQCNINWSETTEGVPHAEIAFASKGDNYEATINVFSAGNKVVIAGEKMIFKNPKGAGKELALRIFGKSGNLVYDAPVVKS